MKELTDSQRRFAKIKADLAIIKWMLSFNLAALLILMIMTNRLS